MQEKLLQNSCGGVNEPWFGWLYEKERRETNGVRPDCGL